MISIAKQTIEYFTKYQKAPRVDELTLDNPSLLESNWSLFVTIYQNGQVRWSSGNIKEIKQNLVEEIIENTIWAISKDTRFKPLKYTEINDIKIRIDKIANRRVLQDKEILKIDPTKSWVLAIKKDYSSMAMILPNINPILLNWEDLIPVLEAKFNIKKFNETDYILYEIKTEVTDDFETTKTTA